MSLQNKIQQANLYLINKQTVQEHSQC